MVRGPSEREPICYVGVSDFPVGVPVAASGACDYGRGQLYHHGSIIIKIGMKVAKGSQIL